ncbi:hypothetical protein N665_1129s0003 [Sinapis alba]|nr:hypothetical protein N665_1129s0003 [Sinapis alba]
MIRGEKQRGTLSYKGRRRELYVFYFSADSLETSYFQQIFFLLFFFFLSFPFVNRAPALPFFVSSSFQFFLSSSIYLSSYSFIFLQTSNLNRRRILSWTLRKF